MPWTLKSEQGVERNQVLHEPVAPLMTTVTVINVLLQGTLGPLETSRYLLGTCLLSSLSLHTYLHIHNIIRFTSGFTSTYTLIKAFSCLAVVPALCKSLILFLLNLEENQATSTNTVHCCLELTTP